MGALRIYRKTLLAKWEKARQIGLNLLEQAQTSGMLKERGDIQVRREITDAIPGVALIRATLDTRYGYVLLIKINNDMIVHGVRKLHSTQHVGHIAPGHWISKACNGARTVEEVFAQITAARMRGETL